MGSSSSVSSFKTSSSTVPEVSTLETPDRGPAGGPRPFSGTRRETRYRGPSFVRPGSSTSSFGTFVKSEDPRQGSRPLRPSHTVVGVHADRTSGASTDRRDPNTPGGTVGPHVMWWGVESTETVEGSDGTGREVRPDTSGRRVP